MSHPDTRHDPENVCTDDDLRHEQWYRELEDFLEWEQQMNQHYEDEE